MPAYNFQSRFAPLVKSGRKRQTIRRKRKDGRVPKVFDPLYLYTGQRTKHCRRLRVSKCRAVLPITMTGGKLAVSCVTVNGRSLPHHECEWLAKADGFRDWEEMRHWFAKPGLPFHGHIILW